MGIRDDRLQSECLEVLKIFPSGKTYLETFFAALWILQFRKLFNCRISPITEITTP